MQKKRIGEFLVDRKILTPAQVEQILEYGKRKGMRFGEAGAELGLLSEEVMARVFGRHFRVDFFHLDSSFLSKQTVLGVDTMVRYGVLPLGFKNEYGLFKSGKMLNLGMLDPGRKDALGAAEKEAQGHVPCKGTKVFLILAEQFLEVLDKVYGVSREDVAKRPTEQVEPTLGMFLEESH